MKLELCCCYLVTWFAFIIGCMLPQTGAGQPRSPERSDELKSFFQRTEQSLMNSVAVGDTSPWEKVLDDSCLITNEEGEVLDKKSLLKQLTGLPPGLSGSIEIADLTVQRFGNFAVVRFRMNEKENVFGQQLATSYRSTDSFRREHDEWKMFASHQSIITTDPPAQEISKDGWPALVGSYRLLPNGWTFQVRLQDGQLYGGRDPKQLRRMIPLASNVFVREGTLGEWIFSSDNDGKARKVVELRKFEPLVWTRP